MASYLTQLRPDIKAESQIPLEPIALALSSRQKAYDHELAKYESFMQNFTNIDLWKGEDMQHFQNNLKVLQNEVKKAGGLGDLSLTGAGKIKNYIAQAADDVVVNGYISTKQARNLISDWDELAKKDPKLYNEENKRFSMQNIYKWAGDGIAGTSINDYSSPYIGKGVGEVIPYVDMLEEADKAIKSLVPEGYVQMSPTGQFEFFKTSGKKLTDTRIINKLELMLSSNPQLQRQLEVNTWSTIGQLSDSDFVNTYKQIHNDQLSTINNGIEELEAELAVTGKKEDREEIQGLIDSYKVKQQSIGTFDETSVLKNREGIQKQLYINDFVSKTADAYKFNSIENMGFEVSPEQKAKWEEANTQRRFDQKMSYDKQKDMNAVVTKMYDLNIEYNKAAGDKGVQGAIESQIVTLQGQLVNNYERELVGTYGYEAAKEIAGVAANQFLTGHTNIFSKGTVETEELTDNQITGQAYGDRDGSKLQVTEELEDFIRNNFDTRNNKYFTPEGKLKTRVLETFFGNNSVTTGEGLENLLLNGIDKDIALNELNAIQNNYNRYKALDKIIKDGESNSDLARRGEITNAFNKAIPYGGKTRVKEIVLPPGYFQGQGIFTTNPSYKVEVDDNGNPLKDGNGNLIIYTTEYNPDASWYAIDKTVKVPLPTPVKSIEELDILVTSQAQKEVTKRIASDYKKEFGDALQGVEMKLTGVGNQITIITELAKSNPNIPQEFANPEYVKEVLFPTEDDDKNIVAPKDITLVTSGLQANPKLIIDGTNYSVNRDKIPNTQAYNLLSNIQQTSKQKLDSELNKKNDLEKLRENKYRPLVVPIPTETNIPVSYDGSLVQNLKARKTAITSNGSKDVQYEIVVELLDKNTQETREYVLPEKFGSYEELLNNKTRLKPSIQSAIFKLANQ